MSTDRIPVLLDTDIGNDIDDAVCLAYLLAQPRCDLVGVTTATGNTLERARMVGAICDLAGRGDIPVHAGAAGPLLMGPGQPTVPQYEVLRDRPHRQDFPMDGVDYLRRTIRDRPGEITLLAIGPMTNLGLLFAIDPEIPSLLKELVLMCGAFTSANGHGPGAREWNALVDPAATHITYRARPPRFTSIGHDITTQVQLDTHDCIRRFRAAGAPLSLVADFTELWSKHRQDITFHDPLAAATIFAPEICDYADGLVTVETQSDTLAGLTSFNPNADEKPHRIATAVDADAFFTHYFDTVGA